MAVVKLLKINSIGIGLILLLSGIITYYLYGGRLISSETHISLKKILIVAIEIAERGGKEVKIVRESANLGETSKGKTKEGANDPLTAGDMRSHRAMFYGMKKAFPDIRIISEEDEAETVDLNGISMPKKENVVVNEVITSDVEVPSKDITIWIDPLDATQEYTENLLHYVTTMVCVAIKGEPVIGIIHKPFEGITAWGWVGHGHSPSLHISQEDKSIHPLKIIVSRSHAGKVKDFAIKAFGEKTEVISAGGAGYKILEVIQGKADAYIHITEIKKWDICAGNALLESIHGKMTTLKGKDIDYSSNAQVKNKDGLLASTYRHNMFLTKIKQSLKV